MQVSNGGAHKRSRKDYYKGGTHFLKAFPTPRSSSHGSASSSREGHAGGDGEREIDGSGERVLSRWGEGCKCWSLAAAGWLGIAGWPGPGDEDSLGRCGGVVLASRGVEAGRPRASISWEAGLTR